MTIGGGWGGVAVWARWRGGAVWAAVGLAGSKSPFSIPFAPLGPLLEPHPGSKLCFLSPQAFKISLPGS